MGATLIEQLTSWRRHAAVLVIAVAAVLMMVGLLIHLVVTALLMVVGLGGSWLSLSIPSLFVISLVWVSIFAGSLFRLIDLRSGGAVLARRFGAVHASDRSRHDKEKQLQNVVAEMAIASSTAQPDTYVLRNVKSINALVLGSDDSRPVIVVTQGALDEFDREQLQAVVAHEFAHIKNADLVFNMRLLVALSGLNSMDEVGRLLIEKGADVTVHPATPVGYLFRALGAFGFLSGRLISAMFSCQREYHADAAAVQFTRNPYGLASALDVVGRHHVQPALHGMHAPELLHLCFQSSNSLPWLDRFSANHPEVALRIKAIEPDFQAKKRKILTQKLAASVTDDVTQMPYRSPFVSESQKLADDTLQNIRAVSDAAENVVSINAISDRIVLLLSNDTLCLAALFALFVPSGTRARDEYMNALGFSFNKTLTDNVKKVRRLLPDELACDQLAVINHISDNLKPRLNQDQRQMVIAKLEKLLDVSGTYQLMEYAQVQLVRRKLEVEHPVVSVIANGASSLASARKAKSFDAMGQEFALLLSLMMETSGASSAELDAQFQRVLKCYTQEDYPRRTANETGIIRELEAAFQSLYIQPKPIRHAFVQHCVEIMKHDGIILPSARALLDLFAASLGCEELIAA